MKYDSFVGTVVCGNKIGRQIGFPTANLSVSNEALLPKNGVYVVRVLIDNSFYYGLLNIGTRPTLNGKEKSVEVNVLDFSEEIYHKKIEIFPLVFIRNEVKFNSLQALTQQLEKDKQFAVNYINFK